MPAVDKKDERKGEEMHECWLRDISEECDQSSTHLKSANQG